MYILPGLIVGAYLTDTGFRNRMQTISSDPRVQDKSSSDRLLIWTSALRMFEANPLGVGLGNFQVAVGDYSEELVRRDAHNTYLRCATEEGIFGIIILAAIAVSAFLCLFRSNRIGWRCPYTWQVRYYSYGLAISLSVVLTSAFFMSMLYIEEFWWVLTMPICLLRAAETEFRVTSEAALTAAEALQESDLDLQPLGYGPGVGYELA
jgi:O-antigen ligase